MFMHDEHDDVTTDESTTETTDADAAPPKPGNRLVGRALMMHRQRTGYYANADTAAQQASGKKLVGRAAMLDRIARGGR